MKTIYKRILDNYQADLLPWYLGYSGGKDSTALISAVYNSIKRLKKFKKEINIIYCDTGIEIPIVSKYTKSVLKKMSHQAKLENVPLKIHVAKPILSDSYFVKVIGCGYPPPTNIFRWCTNRLRINPIKRIMNKNVIQKSIMLLGTRWQESAERTRTLKSFRLENDYSFKQSGNNNTTIFAPISNLTTQEVWKYLHSKEIPDFVNINKLTELYKNANDNCSGICINCNDCTSGRFGCWTCTVIRKDRAMSNLSKNYCPNLFPLLEFRNWLIKIRDISVYRHKKRRNGSIGLGPFTINARKLILDKLKQAEINSGFKLLLKKEEKLIFKIWEKES